MIDDQALRSSLTDSMDVFTRSAESEYADPIAACPGWSLAELVDHVGNVHRTATAFLRAEPGERVEYPTPITPSGDVARWYEEQAAAVLSELDRRDLDEAAPTWTGTRTRRWWLRRQTHELAVHRWDAERALGEPETLDPIVSVDGIDETLEVFVAAMAHWGRRFDPSSGTLHLHATDTDGEWWIDLATDPVEWEHTHAKGDLAIRGPAGALLLVLWGRGSTDVVELLGDSAVLDQWQAGFRI